MKNQFFFITIFIIAIAGMTGCRKDSYPGAEISPYVSIFDIRLLYKNTEVPLTTNNMGGSDSIAGVVVSDHSGNNLSEGIVMLQDSRRLSKLRGIAFTVSNANEYKTGDSLIVKVNGHVLKRQNGLLQIDGITASDIRKVSSGNNIPTNRVAISAIISNPDYYESTQVVIVKGGPNPLPTSTLHLSGDHIINDGFGNIHLITESHATFADSIIPVLGNYKVVVFDSVDANNTLKPFLKLCKSGEVTLLSSQVNATPIVIAGFMSDAKGSDSLYEYIQCLATQDIDFKATPYALVTTNNAGTSTPTGYPTKGWATGGLRTYKINLVSGSAKKGSYFYVGCNKSINGSASTDISGSNWIASYPYGNKDGQGFGKSTANLLANSGNAFGMAIFKDTSVTVNSEPIDVIFIATGGSLYTAGPPVYGYKITNTDFYDKIDPIGLTNQPYYRLGTNTMAFTYNTSDLGYFNMLGGVYNTALGRWTTARNKIAVLLSKQSTISEIENNGSTVLSND